MAAQGVLHHRQDTFVVDCAPCANILGHYNNYLRCSQVAFRLNGGIEENLRDSHHLLYRVLPRHGGGSSSVVYTLV